jgi:hypothetical protein
MCQVKHEYISWDTAMETLCTMGVIALAIHAQILCVQPAGFYPTFAELAFLVIPEQIGFTVLGPLPPIALTIRGFPTPQ